MWSSLLKFWQEVPAPLAIALRHLASFATGIAAALVFFYLLYRVGLPSKPFIYIAF